MDYVWLNGRLVIAIVNYGVFPVHGDQIGRPMYVSHPYSRDVIWAVQDLPFTRDITTNTFWTFNLGFPGQYYDSESGLWHNGYRDYDASWGRYIESDPVGLTGGIHTYAYGGSDPISNVDPLGLCECNKANQSKMNNPHLQRDMLIWCRRRWRGGACCSKCRWISRGR